jgi:hypothetical protein
MSIGLSNIMPEEESKGKDEHHKRIEKPEGDIVFLKEFL